MAKKLWDSYHFIGAPYFVFANKLKRLKLDLKCWSNEVFRCRGKVEVFTGGDSIFG
jgi:hypothetical protein